MQKSVIFSSIKATLGVRFYYKNHSTFSVRTLSKIQKRFEATQGRNPDNNKNQHNELIEKLKEISNEMKSDFYNFYYKNPRKTHFVLAILIAALCVSFFWDSLYPELGYFEMLRLIESEEIREIHIRKIKQKNLDKYIAYSNIGGRIYRTEIMEIEHTLKVISKSSRDVHVTIKTKMNVNDWLGIFSSILIIVFMLRMIQRLIKSKNATEMVDNQSGQIQEFMKTKAVEIKTEDKITKRFKDVAGMDEAKLEISEFVDFLKHPEKFAKLGAKVPKGALLYGPPGTGKTLLAKACAGEANVPFLYVSGSEFLEIFVGVGSSRVRDLFKKAKELAPSIIFIDEIDAIAKQRSDKISSNSEADSTLNQLLVEMDGFEQNKGVVVFGATNRKELLDPAILRPGRLDRMVEINLPDLQGRKQIFLIHLNKLNISADPIMKAELMEMHSKRLASLTPGFSGADIENICNEAAIQAVRSNDTSVKEHHFEIAVERIIGGVERRKFGDKKLKTTVAVHESGHGVVSWFLRGANPLLKLTIIPRAKGSLGFAQYLPDENSLQTKEELLDQIVGILAGRCAELVFFDKITTGAYDDFQKAYKIAYNMVTKLGMSERLGYISLEINQYGIKPYSDKTNRIIDEECKRIIDECTSISIEMVKIHRDKIQKMSDLLLEKETIGLKDIISVLGERPFPLKANFKAILEQSA